MVKTIAWSNGNGDITLTYQGQGNGAITVASPPNNLGVARSETITIETTKGGVKTKNLTISQAACPFPTGDVRNFAYTGGVQSVLLPAGQYKLQCWGAQGGSNAAASSYGITVQAGGKGGYSEGVLTLSSDTTVYIFVGGHGGASGNGGWNGGGGGTGSSSYDNGTELGASRMGCGGGATDIALTTSPMSYSSRRTNRSAASLLSRMIVAGGGSGGAANYRKVYGIYEQVYSGQNASGLRVYNTLCYYNLDVYLSDIGLSVGDTFRIKVTTVTAGATSARFFDFRSSSAQLSRNSWTSGVYATYTVPANCTMFRIQSQNYNSTTVPPDTFSVVIEKIASAESTSNQVHTGYWGGGIEGANYHLRYGGQQNAAGTNGGFGYGGNVDVSSYRYCSGCGGGGWYGGGSDWNNSDTAYVHDMGGGSGFVNTAENASYRPSGYTGLQLDSGTTKAGNTSFESPSGGTETGHAGNGYARITRIS